jgi:hypothetical protein
MKISAHLTTLVTTFILGSSSLALAQPGMATDHRQDAQLEAHGQLGVRGDRWNHQPPAPVAPVWITLASSALRDGRTILPVNPRSGRFSTLMLESTGSAQISGVSIEFANGQKQFVKLAQQLDSRRPLTIDLDGNKRSIKSVVVISRSSNHWMRRAANISVLAA